MPVAGRRRSRTEQADGAPLMDLWRGSAIPAEVLPPAEQVAGVDEAGRGSLAGPVVAAAVILPTDFRLPGLTDSKLLTAAQRRTLADAIRKVAVAHAVAAVDAAQIDAINILRASLKAMAEAVAALPVPPALVLVDGNMLPMVPMRARAVVWGDRLIPAISAASILAKTVRDAMMEAWGLRYPAYGFAEHKGYGTPIHLARLADHGPSPIHRRSFAPVLSSEGDEQGSLW
jgi:ribonuclease HII